MSLPSRLHLRKPAWFALLFLRALPRPLFTFKHVIHARVNWPARRRRYSSTNCLSALKLHPLLPQAASASSNDAGKLFKFNGAQERTCRFHEGFIEASVFSVYRDGAFGTDLSRSK